MIHKLLVVLIGMTMVAPVWSNNETATRQVCVDVKDKEGRPVKLKDGSKIYTNPVFRTEDGKKPIALSAGINIWASQFYRLLGILVIGFLILRVGNPNVMVRRTGVRWTRVLRTRVR